MFQRILRWRRVGLALGAVLALGLATPARAESRKPSSFQQATEMLQAWWTDLWTAKAAPAASTPDPTVIDTERGSGIDPNGRKAGRRIPPRAASRSTQPTGETFTCETIR
jgi:hypothetical protein